MSQDQTVAVIGLGYVGLPLAITFVEAGLEVEGIDANPARVAFVSTIPDDKRVVRTDRNLVFRVLANAAFDSF